MNWYELATSNEVREVLNKLLHTYGFVTLAPTYDDYDPFREVLPKNGFEIAEALWGEYSEELFD